jgi:hypothetical protein
MWDPEAAPYPAGEKLENTIINMKKEIKMSFLRDVFQTADEILSEILEGLIASVAEHSFQIGYNSAM